MAAGEALQLVRLPRVQKCEGRNRTPAEVATVVVYDEDEVPCPGGDEQETPEAQFHPGQVGQLDQ